MNSKVFRNLSYGMYILAGTDEKRFAGCIVNTVFQVTSDPPVIGVSVHKNNYTNQVIKKAGKFSVSILSEDASPDIIREFGFKSGKDTDKFKNLSCTVHEGVPVINDGTCGWFICETDRFVDLSTHTLFFGKVIEGDLTAGQKPVPPMTYLYYQTVIKGSAPKNAPTYQKKESDNKSNVHKEKTVSDRKNENSEKYVYICSICGYQYDGDVPFEDLPDDWTCPVCGEAKSSFQKTYISG